MFEKMVPVNKERHAHSKVKPSADFAFASKFHIAYVTMHEFVRAAATYPIVFLEDKEADDFRPVVLMGLDAGENLFIDEEGNWVYSIKDNKVDVYCEDIDDFVANKINAYRIPAWEDIKSKFRFELGGYAVEGQRNERAENVLKKAKETSSSSNSNLIIFQKKIKIIKMKKYTHY